MLLSWRSRLQTPSDGIVVSPGGFLIGISIEIFVWILNDHCILKQASIGNGDGGASVSHLGNQQWV